MQVSMRFGIFWLLLLGAGYQVRAEILYSVTDLGNLGGASSTTYATAINNAGQITGFSILPHGTDEHAFLYSNGQMQDLGTLGGSSSAGYGINSAGQVTGFSEISSGSGHMFLCSNGQMTDLGPGEGVGINNRGQIIGTAVAAGFIYSNGQRQVVGPLPGEPRRSHCDR